MNNVKKAHKILEKRGKVSMIKNGVLLISPSDDLWIPIDAKMIIEQEKKWNT